VRRVPWVSQMVTSSYSSSVLRSFLFGVTTAADLILLPALASSSDVQEGPWRVSDNDAINALYMFLRTHGYEGKYEAYLSQVQALRDAPSMISLRNASNKMGHPTAIVKTAVEDVITPGFPKPAIVFVDGPGGGVGRWEVVLYANKEHVAVLTGGTMIVMLVPMDQFRMDWTGYALIAESQQPCLRILLWCSSLGSAALAALFLTLRGRRSALWRITGARITKRAMS
jgi:hypothetical protein